MHTNSVSKQVVTKERKTKLVKYLILEREERIRLYCNLSKVEDESHFLLECPLYNHERSTFFNEIGSICEIFLSLNNHDKFYWILNNEDYKILSIFSKLFENLFQFEKTIWCTIDYKYKQYCIVSV